MAIGAVGIADIFRFDPTHAAIWKKATDEAATALANRFNRIGSLVADSNISDQTVYTPGAGKSTADISHIQMTPDYTAMKKYFRPVEAGTASEAPPEIVSELGKTYGGAAASGVPPGFIILYREFTDTHVRVLAFPFVFLETLGGTTTKAKEHVKPKTELESIPLKKADDLIIPAALFDTDIVEVPVSDAARTLAYGSWEFEDWWERAF